MSYSGMWLHMVGKFERTKCFIPVPSSDGLTWAPCCQGHCPGLICPTEVSSTHLIFDFKVKCSRQIEYKSLLQFDCSSWIRNVEALVIYVSFKSIFVKAQELRALNYHMREVKTVLVTLVWCCLEAIHLIQYISQVWYDIWQNPAPTEEIASLQG